MILALRDLLSAAKAPLDEAVAYASYLSAEASVQFAEMRVARAKAELAACIASRDAALAQVRQSEPPPRVVPAFLLRKEPGNAP